MNDLLIFFAFPVAIIILSAIYQTIIHCPIKIAGITFAIFLIITFAFFDETFLIATIIYTIIAYLTALVVHFINRIIRQNISENKSYSKFLEDVNDKDLNNSNSDELYNSDKMKYYNYRRYR